MSSNDYILSIDLGTTGCKTVIFDLEGNEVSKEYVEYPLYVSGKENLSEQDPLDWWNAVVYTIRKSLIKKNISPSKIKGVGVTGQSTSVVFLSERGSPLRPAILYSDARAEKYIPEMTEKVGQMNYVENKFFTNLRWIRENEPETYSRISHVIDAKEFIGYKLTGELTMDSFVIDPKRLEMLAQAFDVPTKFFGRFHTYSEPIGYISGEASELTSLSEGTPVIIGPWDGMCNIIGSGLMDEGDTMDVAGTTEIVASISLQKIDDFSYKHVLEGRWIAYTSTSLAVSFRWFRDILLSLFKVSDEIDIYEVLNSKANKVPPGSNGLLFIPTMQGEFFKPHLRGGFIGLSLDHNIGHITRAIFEGVALYLRKMLESFEERGFKIGNIRVSGGGANSSLWNQIKADVLNKKLLVLKSKETAALGAAMLAATALGYYSHLEKAMSNMSHVAYAVEPNPKNVQFYDKLYRKFINAFKFFDEFLL